MPIHLLKDSKGEYYIYGTDNKKYYFKTEAGKKRAYNKCLRQMRAIKKSEQEKSYKLKNDINNVLNFD